MAVRQGPGGNRPRPSSPRTVFSFSWDADAIGAGGTRSFPKRELRPPWCGPYPPALPPLARGSLSGQLNS